MSENRILYGVAIREAIASGDLEQMRAVAQEADEHLAEHGNVSAAAEALKVEIARTEQQGGSA